MKTLKRISLALLIIFAIYQTYNAQVYKSKCEVLTSHVFNLVEKKMDSTFVENNSYLCDGNVALNSKK